MQIADIVTVVDVFMPYIAPTLGVAVGVGFTLWVGGAVWEWVRGRR